MKLKNYPKKYMSLREWKKLAESKTKAGKMKNQLYNQITAEKIKSKTSDAAITKSFRLDEIIEGLKGKPAAPRVRKRVPVKIEEGIDYAPEVDPYEDMDVEGLLNLEDYVPPQPGKQIAPKPPKYPKYQMDPSYWQMDPGMSPPPAYDDLSIPKEPDESLTIEALPDEAEDDEGDETEDDEGDEAEDDEGDVNKIFDQYKLPNYDDVQKRLEEPEMTATKQRKYLNKVLYDAESVRKKITIKKTHASNALKRGEITKKEKDGIYENVSQLEKVFKDFREYHQKEMKKFIGKGIQKGAGVYFYNDAKELLQKLTLIIGEMEAGNTSIQMRNTGQSILDTLLRTKAINKAQYQN